MQQSKKLIGNDILPASRPRVRTFQPAYGVKAKPSQHSSVFSHKSVDGIRTKVQRKHEPFVPRMPFIEKPAVAVPASSHETALKVKTARAISLPTFNANTFAYDLLIIVVLGFISFVSVWVNWAFLAYGIYTLVRRLPSQRIFVSALVCLIFVPILNILHRSTLSNSFAVFTFYFLVFGLIRACIELRFNKA
jgi:hypothetical protein